MRKKARQAFSNHSERRRKPAQQRSQKLVDDVLEATAQVLAEVGYERASTNKIARRAGVSVGSIYQYFPDKEALISAIIEDRSRRLETIFTRRLISMMDHPFAEVCEAVLRICFEFIAAEPALMRVLVTANPHFMEEQQYSAMEQRVQQAAKMYLMRNFGKFDADDLDTALFVCTNVVSVFATRIALGHGREIPKERLIKSVVVMLAGYIDSTGKQRRASA